MSGWTAAVIIVVCWLTVGPLMLAAVGLYRRYRRTLLDGQAERSAFGDRPWLDLVADPHSDVPLVSGDEIDAVITRILAQHGHMPAVNERRPHAVQPVKRVSARRVPHQRRGGAL